MSSHSDPHTRLAQAAVLLPESSYPVAPPLYQTASFATDEAGVFLDMATRPLHPGFYTRYGNPTTRAFESAVAGLEGGECALATASGMGAITAALLAFAGRGDHVVAQRVLYGGTTGLLQNIGELAVLRSTQDWLDGGGELDETELQRQLATRAAGYGSALRTRWGLPLGLRGHDTDQTREARAFVATLQDAVGDGVRERICPAMAIASLIGIAKPLPPGPIRKFTDAAVVIPTTCPASLTTGPPESPARTGAANSKRPLISSLVPVSSSSALTVRLNALTVPISRVRGAPLPPALPSATTGWPGASAAESPIGAGGRPAAPCSCRTAMSFCRS